MILYFRLSFPFFVPFSFPCLAFPCFAFCLAFHLAFPFPIPPLGQVIFRHKSDISKAVQKLPCNHICRSFSVKINWKIIFKPRKML